MMCDEDMMQGKCCSQGGSGPSVGDTLSRIDVKSATHEPYGAIKGLAGEAYSRYAEKLAGGGREVASNGESI